MANPQTLLALASEAEHGQAADQFRIISEAALAVFGWQDERYRRVLRLLEAGAFLDAALTLVPEGWRYMAGHREYPHARAYVENGKPTFAGVGTRRNPDQRWFEVTAATPALALCAAALRARLETEAR